MIVVKETLAGVFEPIAGNPVLLSRDGKVKAPLLTILAPSWSAADRAAFGVYIVEPFLVPDGAVATGPPRYEKQGDVVIEVRDLGDAPAPQPGRYELLAARVDAIEARLAALEGTS